MSNAYSISVMLDAIYNEENIQIILSRGSHHITYFKLADKDGVALTPNEAALALFAARNEPTLHAITLKIEETYLNLHCYMENNLLHVMFTDFSQQWLKIFFNGNKDIDVARYVKVLLDLTQDFRILTLNVNCKP